MTGTAGWQELASALRQLLICISDVVVVYAESPAISDENNNAIDHGSRP